MAELIAFLKFLATSNTINFIIMVAILVWIVNKINLKSSLNNSIDNVKETITKSDAEKQKSQAALDEAKALIDRLPEDVKTLEQNSAQKINIFKSQIEEDTQKTIFNIEKNIDRVISIEEKKISNLLTDKTSQASVELAKAHITDLLKSNPELHNQFIQSSLEELEKVNL